MSKEEYSLEDFREEYKHTFNLGFCRYLGIQIEQRNPTGLDLGEFLKSAGWKIKLGLVKL